MPVVKRAARCFNTDAGLSCLVFLICAAGAGSYLTAFNITTGPEYQVYDVMRPALCVATGHGLSEFFPDSPETRDFLSKKTPNMAAQDFPSGALIGSAWHNKFFADRYFLVYSVALLWRLFGISWQVVNVLIVLLFAISGALVFGIFRLGMGRGFSLAGTALTMMSPVVLSQLPYLRDFCKAPFILATILFCGYLLVRTVSLRRLLALAGVMGFVIGVGVGFRQDSIICLPPALLFLGFFARGSPTLSWRARLAAGLFLLAAFIPPALPALSMTSNTGGNNAFYLTQGFSEPCLRDLDLEPASYAPLSGNQDEIVGAYIESFVERHFDFQDRMHRVNVLARINGTAQIQALFLNTEFMATLLTPLSRLDLWSKSAEIAARRYVYELAATFPADVVSRWYASVLRIVRHLGPLCQPARSNPVLQELMAVEAPLARHLYQYGAFYALATLLILSWHSYWRAMGALFLLMYFFGYPSLEFQMRHAFHLNFASIWFPAFLLHSLTAAAIKRGSRRSIRQLCRRESLLSAGRMAAFAVSAAALIAVPLSLARAWQNGTVTDLHHRYRQADLEALPVLEQVDSRGNTRYCPERIPAFDSHPPAALFNALASLGLPVTRVPSVLVEYLVAEFETTRATQRIAMEFADGRYGWDAVYDVPEDAAGRSIRFFFPVFRFTNEDERESPAAFKGASFDPGVTFKGFYRVRNSRDFPLLMNVWLPSDPALFRKCHGVRWFTSRSPDPPDGSRTAFPGMSLACVVSGAAWRPRPRKSGASTVRPGHHRRAKSMLPSVSAVIILLLLHASSFGQAGPAPSTGQVQTLPQTVPGSPLPPSLHDVLSFAPDSASVALVFPPLETCWEKIFALAERISASGLDFRPELKALAARLAPQAESSPKQALTDAFRDRGFDPGAPCGIFMDFTAQAREARQTYDMIKSLEVRLGALNTGEPPGGQHPRVDLENADILAFVRCADSRQAASSVQFLLREVLGNQTPETTNSGAFVIQTYGEIAYSLAANWLLISNRASLLEETLARIETPSPAPFAFSSLPPFREDEIVLVSRLDRLTMLLPDWAAVLTYGNSPHDPMNPPMAQVLGRPSDLFAGEEPNITTLNVSPDRIELVSRLNLATHPRYAAYVGEPRPVRLARYFPEDSLLLGCLQLNDQIRDIFATRFLSLLTAFEDPTGRFEAVRQVLAQLSGEVAFGVLPSGAALPNLFLIAEVLQPESMKSLIERLVTVSAWQDEGAEPLMQFAQVTAFESFPLYVGLSDQALFLATDQAVMQKLAQRMAEKIPTQELESLTPPFDPDARVFSFLVIKAGALEVLAPFLPEGQSDTLRRTAGMLRELRAGKLVQDHWQQLFISAYLK